ncbi:hypothetical protein OHA59_47185 [Streptomyces sp. NBC_01589]|uniref:hypothetical protein n=1 Tax=Streptomyces sp. NBC_01589 TaxID=2975886 RepID=UPI00386B9D7E
MRVGGDPREFPAQPVALGLHVRMRALRSFAGVDHLHPYLRERRGELFKDVQETACALQQLGVGVRSKVVLVASHIEKCRQVKVQLLHDRLLVARRRLGLQNDELDLACPRGYVLVSVGGDVTAVDEGPDAVDTAVVRTVHDAVRDFVVVEIPVLQRLVSGEEGEEILPPLIRGQPAVLIVQDAVE